EPEQLDVLRATHRVLLGTLVEGIAVDARERADWLRGRGKRAEEEFAAARAEVSDVDGTAEVGAASIAAVIAEHGGFELDAVCVGCGGGVVVGSVARVGGGGR